MAEKTAEKVLVIEVDRIEKEYLKDLIRYRELFYFFAWRDILVRYKQAVFGISWALIRPVLNMLLFTLLFGYIAHLPSDAVPYSLFVLAGMLPWQLFSNAIIDVSNSLINNANLISKTYFPRIIIPFAQIIIHLFDYLIGILLLILLSVFRGYLNPITLLLFPLFTGLAILLCAGVGLWLSALTVKYRDFRFIIPFVVQFGVFVSPVGYGSFIIPEKWRWLYSLNPMVGIIDGIRYTFFGISYPGIMLSITLSIIVTSLILISGFAYFRRMERTFADII
jgi:lipopolysaccharide transport system permease protein